MDRLSEMEAFVQVVDCGGFTDAARKIGVSKSAVSKSVSSLESRLGVRLLTRTTRRVSPTDLGLAYYDRALRVLKDAADADEMVTSMQASPRGSLRISVPVSFGVKHLSRAVAGFLREYPDVSVNMVLDDRFVELVAEGFDLAIRIGVLEDSSLRARKLATARLRLVASEGYIARKGAPASIDDLADHTLLHYSNLATGNFWKLRAGSGEERQVRVGGQLTANNGEALMEAVGAGLGIGLVPSFITGGDLAPRGLVELLPGAAPAALGIYAVYPEGPFPQPKLRAIIDWLAAHFRDTGPDDWPA